MRFDTLAQFARERGYTVERTSKRTIEWWRNDDHSMIGVCSSVQEAHDEIFNDYARRINEQRNS